jgi:hypothetical protein
MEDSSLKHELINELLRQKENLVEFEKRGYQRNPVMLKKVVQDLRNRLPSGIDALCALGTSGLGFAVFLAHELSLPLFFFKSDGWPKLRDGRTLLVLPETNRVWHVLLVDSHYRSSYTWAKAETVLLEQTSLKPKAIVVLFEPNTIKPMAGCTVPIISIVKSNEDEELIRISCKHPESEKLISLLQPKSSFWGGDIRPTDVGMPGHYLRHINGFLSSDKLGPPQFDIIEFPAYLKKEMRKISTNDPDIWKYYQYPELIKEISIVLGQTENFLQYRNLIGVNILGTALAHSLVFHNFDILGRMRIFSAYFEKNLIPLPRKNDMLEPNLLCQIRLTSGLLPNDALKLIRKESGSCNKLLTLRTDLTIEPSRRQKPLSSLKSNGIDTIRTVIFEN